MVPGASRERVLAPVVGALLWASLGLLVPRALGVGYDAISDVLAGHLGVTTLLVLLVAKLVVWWLALASGISRGTLAPVLLIAACFGAVAGESIQTPFPHMQLATGTFALAAMAATFGAATRAPSPRSSSCSR